MVGYEAIDILQEALKDTPFWKFVQPLFGGVEMKMSVAMDAGGENSTNGTETTETAEADYADVRSIVREPTATELIYANDAMKYLGHLEERIDGIIASIERKNVFSEQRFDISFEPNELEELKALKAEIEEIKSRGIPRGEVRNIVLDIYARTASLQQQVLPKLV